MNARRLIGLLVLTVAGGTALAQNALALRRTARIEPGRPLLLGDIALITGPDADSLGRIAIADEPGAEPRDTNGWFGIGIQTVRERLKTELGLNAGMIALSGSRCDVQIVAPATAPAGPAPAPRSLGPAGAEGLVGLRTVRGAVAREIVRLLRIPAADLKLEFESGDDSTLDTPLTGRTIEISAMGASDRMPFAVVLHEANGRSIRRTVRVTVLVRRQVATAARAVERGASISAEDLATEERWLHPGDPTIGQDLAVGAVARRRLGPGDLLTNQLIEPPILVHKGDRLYVRVVLNGMVMRRYAVAVEDGAEGDVIDFTAANDPRQRFQATVVGRNDALAGQPGSGTPVASDITPAQ